MSTCVGFVPSNLPGPLMLTSYGPGGRSKNSYRPSRPVTALDTRPFAWRALTFAPGIGQVGSLPDVRSYFRLLIQPKTYPGKAVICESPLPKCRRYARSDFASAIGLLPLHEPE